MRRRIAVIGERPHRVLVFEDRGHIWCSWYVAGRAKHHRFPGRGKQVEREAAAWGRRYVRERRELERNRSAGDRRPLTLGALWDRYRDANAGDWRSKTLKGYEQYFGALADVLGPAYVLDKLSLDDVDGFKMRRRKQRIAHSQIRRQIGFLRQMVTWAHGRELLGAAAALRLTSYRYVIPKDEREAPPAEYAREDLLKIAAELKAPRHWRARGVIALCGSLGARINAVLHLKWADVDLDAGTVRWSPEYDKTGEERTQPLTPGAHAALVEAHGQRHESEPWVFWALRAKGRPYHYNSVDYHLREAEERANVPHLTGRAFHGLRRMVVNDIGDLRDAGDWVGQRSLKVTAGYSRERVERVERARQAIARREVGG